MAFRLTPALGWGSCSNFAIATYLLLVDGFIFLRFDRGSFVCYVNSGSDAPQNTFLPKVDKLCWNEAIRLHVVEKDT